MGRGAFSGKKLKREKFLRKYLGRILMILATIVIFVMSICSWTWLSKETNGNTVRNVALTIGGLWTAYAVSLAATRIKIMQQQQVSENLARASEQLSSTVMSIRILAILSLEKIAIEVQDEIRQDVVKVLCAHIREKHSIDNGKSLVVDDDIKEIIYVLGNVQIQKDKDININLSKISLLNVQFSGVILKYAVLSGANLLGAVLLEVRGLGTAKNLETVKNSPQEIILEVQDGNRGDE